MSLAKLRAMRLDGAKPDAVRILVGTKPKWLEDAADIVHIRPIDDLNSLDLRALVGLRCTVVELEPNTPLVLKVAAAVVEAGAIFVGGVCSTGAAGASEEHEAAMRRYREVLCP